jgi:NADH dehydrogenase FAD-containing subunit/uncharacterized membrane protein YphA (DoxX/SURF4 family)
VSRTSRAAHLAAVMVRWASDATRIAEKTIGPLLDVFIRLWLAGIFWTSGMVKLQNWTIALYLSAHEYPVSWLDPATAAWLGEAIEIVGPPLLVFGLATRFAALPMLILSLVIQFSYQALDQHLFWAILFGWFVVEGAGPISLDALIGRGVAATALPLAGTITRIFEAMSRWGDPVIKLLLRCWIAALFFRSGVMKISNFDMTQMLFHARSAQTLLPPGLAARLTILLELGCLVFLVLGGTRITAILLIGLIAVVDPTFQHQIDLAYYLMVLGLIAIHGPGALSLDSLVARTLRRRFPEFEGMGTVSYEGTPRVLIVGGGFGGVAAAKALRNTSCRVTLIDQRNYYLFQPLLYQVATAGLSPADIAGPIRGLFRDQPNVRVLLGGVTDVDLGTREVIIGRARVPYDYLVIAAGTRHSYFGHDEWALFAPGLKQIEDATNIRSRLLFAFEQAENAESPAVQREMLTFVIVGGGPTGVELAGAIAELASHGLAREFRAVDPSMARVILMQAGPRILPTFPEGLSRQATALTALGVEVLTDSAVERIDDQGVVVSGRPVAARNVFWAAGVMASPAAQWLKAEADRAGRVKVVEDLSVSGLPDIFAIGDTALSNGWDGKPVPGLAPAAKQQGRYVASVINARIEGRTPPTPFRYRHAGSLATIGRKAAVADFGRLQLSGALAWWVWGAVHILFLSGMRNRVVIALEWFWAYLTYRPSTRLITGEIPIRTRSTVASSTVDFLREK